MISGPVVPRTIEGLWDLVRSDPERLESGLTLIEERLVIDEDLRIDAVARDAAHGPVFLFAALAEEERSLPGKIMEAREWLQRNQCLLRQALPDRGLRLDREPRCMIVGFDLSEAFLRHLSAIEAGDLVAYRFETLIIDDEVHVGVNQLLGPRPGKLELNSLPDGPAGDARAYGLQFVDLIKRMEPDCEIGGDRFSRSYYADHGLLARLQVEGSSFRAFSPCGASLRLVHLQDPNEIADTILRYRSLMANSMIDDDADCSAGEIGEKSARLIAGGLSAHGRQDPHVQSSSSSGGSESIDPVHLRVEARAEGSAAEDLGSAVGQTLEGLRRRMSKLKVSQEEFEAFGDLGVGKVDE